MQSEKNQLDDTSTLPQGSTQPAIEAHGLRWGNITNRIPIKWVTRELCVISEDYIEDGKTKGDGFVDIIYLDWGYKKELLTIYDPVNTSLNKSLRTKVQQFLKEKGLRLSDLTEPYVIEEWQLHDHLRDGRRQSGLHFDIDMFDDE